MATTGMNMDAPSHPRDRVIPFIDAHGCTNAVKPWMAKSGLNMDAPSHPCDRVIPFIHEHKNASQLTGIYKLFTRLMF